MTTFTSVGYGDMSPITEVEILFIIVMQFIGIAFFAYLMANVSSIVADLASKKNVETVKQDNLQVWLMRLD